MKESSTHWCDGSVDYVEEAASFRVKRIEEFEVSDGESVKAYIFPFFDSCDGGDVACTGMLSEVEVVEDSSSGDNCQGHTLDAEAFQRISSELLAQTLIGCRGCENPVFELESRVCVLELLQSLLFESALYQQFLWRQIP